MKALRHGIVATAREWGWPHSGWAVLVGSLAVFNMGELLFFPDDLSLRAAWLYNVLQFGFPFVFAIRVADHAVAQGSPRNLTYALAVLLVIAAGVWVFGPLLVPLLGGNARWSLRDDVGLVTTRLLPFAMGTYAYMHWRREREARHRLAVAEVERARQAQLVQTSRLLALQARIEPQFLFDALGRVRDALDRSVDVAEQRLADLITLLRSLQPATDATASSLGREFALVHAFGRAADLPALQPENFALDADDVCRGARFAPLVLLPVLRCLAEAAPGARWRATATLAGDRLQVVVRPALDVPSAVAALQALDPRELRERLTTVHGADADLSVSAEPLPALRLLVPFDPAHEHEHEPARPDR
ncbi:MAG TPA: hypothetical protein VFQ16_14555 [Burkholderiaceae bacterium]|nr:hypothetical protein [Burkholderiaceae bacterium]